MRNLSIRSTVALPLLASISLFAGCGSSTDTSTSSGGSTTTTTTSSTSTGGSGGTTTTSDTTTTTPPSTYCDAEMLPVRPWSDGPYGTHRNETAADFSLELADGTTWSFKDSYSGCESYVFIPDSLHVSDQNTASVWTKDLATLLKTSPKNVHYFFVSRSSTDDGAKVSTDAMKAYVDTTLGALAAADAEHWKARLHVASKRAKTLGNWVGDILGGIGRMGFAIDRFQRVRGLGYLADVKRYKQALNDAGLWPFESNLVYAEHEPRYFNFEVDRQAKLDAEDATVIPFWTGEVLSQFAETDVTLPSEADMAKFDTLEVEVESGCPDPDAIEFNNCGAWDYIAALSVRDDATMTNIEIARFITSYHRETHWVVDISPMLAHLKKGGARHFRWEFAPEWNVQPTATKLSLRLSNKSKGYAPYDAKFLWAGGDFNSMYNAPHAPTDVPIPADAKHVELVAIVTGHGSGSNQCSEFCNHQHSFKVNGTEYRKEHKEAGTSNKCIDHIENGMVPNQAGTWWYGRGGWCPGQQVDPWVVDITANVTPGMPATIEYQGLYANGQPPDNSGNIDLVSYLVFYR
ncbi:MAG: peptide-N-glycosidase F-related protein [Polyangiaceae bacterium]